MVMGATTPRLLVLAIVLVLAACSAASTGTLESEPVVTGSTSGVASSSPETTASSTASTPTTGAIASTSTTAPSEPPRSLEWIRIADLAMAISGGSIVASVEGAIVVAQTESTSVVGFDGSITNGDKPPVTLAPGCCGSAVGIPIRDQLVLFDSYAPGTWLLDLKALTWNRVGDRPSTGDVLGSALIGDLLYVVTAAARTGAATSPVAVLNTTTWEWSEIEQVPSAISVGGVTSDGDRLIVAGVRQNSNNIIVGDSREPLAYAYEEPVWRELPDIPIDGQAATVAWVDDVGLLAWNYGLRSALRAPGENWEPMGRVPMELSECYPQSYQVDSGVIAACGGIAYFEAASRRWSPIPIRSDARYVAADDSVYELAPSGDLTTLSVHHLSTGQD